MDPQALLALLALLGQQAPLDAMVRVVIQARQAPQALGGTRALVETPVRQALVQLAPRDMVEPAPVVQLAAWEPLDPQVNVVRQEKLETLAPLAVRRRVPQAPLALAARALLGAREPQDVPVLDRLAPQARQDRMASTE